jgi:tetratricopeptide (TPR) repeat protein
MRAAAACLARLAACVPLPTRLEDGHWIELRSPHFRLRTSFTVSEARSILVEAEDGYDYLAQFFRSYLPDTPPVPAESIELVVFASRYQKGEVFPRSPGGGHFTWGYNEPEPRPAILFLPDDAKGTRATLWHEIGHRMVSHFLPSAPRWLNEGFAQMFATGRVTRGQLLVGEWQSWLFSSGYRPTLQTMLVGDSGDFKHGHYTEAQALVHLLSSERAGYRARFLQYLQRLNRGVRSDLAWRDGFAEKDLDSLQYEMNTERFSELQREPLHMNVARAPAVAITEPRTLSNEEVRLIRVAYTDRPDRRVLEIELRAMVSPKAIYWLAVVNRDELKRALEKYPDEPRLLALAVAESPELWPKLQQHAETPTERAYVALWLSERGRDEEALALAKRAVSEWPWSPDCWAQLAQVAQRAGRFVEANAAMQRAVWLVPQLAKPLLMMRRLRIAAQHAGVDLPVVAPWPMALSRRTSGEMSGQIVTTDGHGVPAWIFASAGERFEVAHTDDSGSFHVALLNGDVQICALPDDENLLADEWHKTVRTRMMPLSLGTFVVLVAQRRDRIVARDGIDAKSQDGVVRVEAVARGSAAAEAGVLVRDQILEINGRSVNGLGHDAIDFLLDGDVGQVVELRLRRKEVDRTTLLRLKPAFPI